jgi:hypothetical protein
MRCLGEDLRGRAQTSEVEGPKSEAKIKKGHFIASRPHPRSGREAPWVSVPGCRVLLSRTSLDAKEMITESRRGIKKIPMTDYDLEVDVSPCNAGVTDFA